MACFETTLGRCILFDSIVGALLLQARGIGPKFVSCERDTGYVVTVKYPLGKPPTRKNAPPKIRPVRPIKLSLRMPRWAWGRSFFAHGFRSPRRAGDRQHKGCLCFNQWTTLYIRHYPLVSTACSFCGTSGFEEELVVSNFGCRQAKAICRVRAELARCRNPRTYARQSPLARSW